MAAGEPRTRFPRPWSAGAGGGPAASSRKSSSTSSSTRWRQRRDWPQASVEQLIGDHYASCMDEARIDQLGLAPLRAPARRDRRTSTTPADVEREIGAASTISPSPCPSAVASSPDNHEPTQVIANVFASGLGLPDRDYYVKPEPRFREAREKYVAHVAQMFTLAGRAPASARGRGRSRLGVREEARRGLARQRGPARPRRHRPQDDVRRPAEAGAAPRLGRVLHGSGPAARRPQRAASRSSCWRSIVS